MALPGGADESGAAVDAFVKLLRAATSVSSRVHAHLAEEGLTDSQFGVLEAISHRGPLYQRELAHKILKTGGNITMVVDNLERRGLVRRERDAADRRLVSVAVTPQGAELMARVLPRQLEAIRRELAPLSVEEQAQLGALCRKIGLKPSGR
ncbi:MAG: MarR family transcriptional regulator [Deltaproteobacteria bacterium]|nr:MarR family transcriptional regulator [Deltaproteobacteria bacterium]